MKATIVSLLFVVLAGTACELSPEQRAAVAHAAATDCKFAIDLAWPAELRARANQIVHRESRYDHTAANPSSTARGCWQLIHSLHAWRYTAVGCTTDWSHAYCNSKAAYHLYQDAGGWGPWT